MVRTLYLDPELNNEIKIKIIKDKIDKKEKVYKSVRALVVDMWEIFFDNIDNFKIKGYSKIKGKIIKTPDMIQSSVLVEEELNKKIENYLSNFTRSQAENEEKNFSHITNELIKRIYFNEEI